MSKTQVERKIKISGSSVVFYVSVIAMTAFFYFVMRPIKVFGMSMYPTLRENQLGFMCYSSDLSGGIKRFDYVVVHPEDSENMLIKRVIGLPGETLEYKNDKLYIDGTLCDEEFLDTEYRKMRADVFTQDIEKVTLSEDEYYVLGDNRPSSRDSRYYGPFKKENIVGKAYFFSTGEKE